MESHKSAQYPYRWKNGTWHSRPENTQTYTPQKPAVAPKGPAIAAAPPGPPGTPVQPLDPNVVNSEITGQRNVAIGDLNATWQQGNLDQTYGFGAGGAANPYSRVALAGENLKRSQLGTLNSYAGQGQLYSGAYDRMQNENQRNYDIGYDQLRRDYDQQSGNLQLGRLQSYADAGSGVDQAKWAALFKSLGGL